MSDSLRARSITSIGLSVALILVGALGGTIFKGTSHLIMMIVLYLMFIPAIWLVVRVRSPWPIAAVCGALFSSSAARYFPDSSVLGKACLTADVFFCGACAAIIWLKVVEQSERDEHRLSG